MNCLECQELLNRRLDGEPGIDPAWCGQHLAACPDCRDLFAAAGRLEEGLRIWPRPDPPAGLADRIVNRALVERRAVRARRRRLQAVLAVAAGLLTAVLVGYYWPRPSLRYPVGNQVQQVPAPGPVPAAPVAALHQDVQEAGSALVALLSRTADETVVQGRLLWPERVPTPALNGLAGPAETGSKSLQEAGQGLSAGMEPVATSARRAINLFLREIPPLGSNQ